ncbi:DUF6894 family protein [Methylobacterium radiodurans]|uniref:DUF6894 family protein n=1 Tax=Methylobacterium radiodurans TaxID=2202828 RepID=UPI00194DD08C|nr:catalase [Methylobacterium radiodurans]
MIRVFFNIRLDDAYLPERTGQWVEDEAEARDLARIIVRRLVADHGGEPRLLNAELAVTVDGGASLFDVSFFEALYVPVSAPAPAAPLRRAEAIRPPARLVQLVAPWRAQALTLASVWRRRLAGLPALLSGRQRSAPRPRFRLGFVQGG